MVEFDITTVTRIASAVAKALKPKLVPQTRKINNKPLTADITLGPGDVSAVPASDKGAAGGVATLNGAGLVVQNPASLGVASGVAGLGTDARLPFAQMAMPSTITSGWIVSNALLNGATGSVRYIKLYGIVYFLVVVTISTPGEYAIFSIPATCRPGTECALTAVSGANAVRSIAATAGIVLPAGPVYLLKMGTADPAAGTYFLSGSWVANV